MGIEKINLKSMGRDELQADLVDRGLKKFRAGQILTWIYTYYARILRGDDEHSENGARTAYRPSFLSRRRTSSGRKISKDGTRKFLFALEDEHTIESVLIPDEDRQTLCISSQVGCQQACRFLSHRERGLYKGSQGL